MASISKNNNGLWDVQFYYKDLQGRTIKKHKRNFKTKREAQAYIDSFTAAAANSLDMTFSELYRVYCADMSKRLRQSTMITKSHIMQTKVLPYFGNRKITDIKAADIRKWQAELIGSELSETYIKTINNQISAVFNYAVRYYDLPYNPVTRAGSIGKGRAPEMRYWTVEEFDKFVIAVMDKPISYNAFTVLFWTGLRLSEMLALTLSDFDPAAKTLSVNKSIFRAPGGEDIVTAPKTEKSIRVVTLPDFLVEQLNGYISILYGLQPDDRLFPVTKDYMEKEMKRGIKLSGVKPIRIHDLRHSHASMLISTGADPKLVADRLGHNKIQTTLDTYSHLYPNQARSLADSLDLLRRSKDGDKHDKDKNDKHKEE